MQDNPKYAPLSGAVQYANHVNEKRVKTKLPIEITEAMILDCAIDDSIAIWGRFSDEYKAGNGRRKPGKSTLSELRKCLPVSSIDISALSEVQIESTEAKGSNFALRRKAMKVIDFGRFNIKRSPEEITLYIQMLMYQEPEFDPGGRLRAKEGHGLSREDAEFNAKRWAEEGDIFISSSELLREEKLLNCSAVEARLQALRWGKKEHRRNANLVLLDRQDGFVAVLLEARAKRRKKGRNECPIVSFFPESAELLFDLTDVAKVFGEERTQENPDKSPQQRETRPSAHGQVAGAINNGVEPNSNPSSTPAEQLRQAYLRGNPGSDETYRAKAIFAWAIQQIDPETNRPLHTKKNDILTRCSDKEPITTDTMNTHLRRLRTKTAGQ